MVHFDFIDPKHLSLSYIFMTLETLHVQEKREILRFK